MDSHPKKGRAASGTSSSKENTSPIKQLATDVLGLILAEPRAGSKETDTSQIALKTSAHTSRSPTSSASEIPTTPQLAAAPMPPSEQEREYWYDGLSAAAEARPHLIARSSTERFRYENYRFDRGWQSQIPDPEKKFISTIGAHPIVKVYDHGLRAKVLDILNGIKWQCVDVVRLGYSDEPKGKPVVLITADEEEVEQSDAQRVVEKIHALMDAHALSDVHAEVKAGRCFDARRYVRGDIYPVAFNTTPFLGASIGNRASDEGVGSICLYLDIRNEPFALTCRHVAWASDAPCPDTSILSSLGQEAELTVWQVEKRPPIQLSLE